MRFFRYTCIAISAALVVAGCKVGPNYHTPDMKLPAQFSEASTKPSTQPSVDLQQWWRAFDDPTLDSLIDRAVTSNYNLKQATLRVRQAREQRGVVAADWWPTVNVGGSYERQRRAEG